MANKIKRSELWSLEEYAVKRPQFRREVLSHKQDRQLALSDNLRLIFEDRLTIQYQIQEMLRIEKTFTASGIEEELDVYNPLIPDGSNLKATMMLEFEDVDERQIRLQQLSGIENKIWIQVAEAEKIYAIADEDLERSTTEKTSAVHFMRFELPSPQVQAIHQGADIKMGVDHHKHRVEGITLAADIRQALAGDLDKVV